MTPLFHRIATMISYGSTPAEIHDALIGEHSNEFIYLNWVAARMWLADREKQS